MTGPTTIIFYFIWHYWVVNVKETDRGEIHATDEQNLSVSVLNMQPGSYKHVASSCLHYRDTQNFTFCIILYGRLNFTQFPIS